MEIFEAITHVVQPPLPNTTGTSAQYRRDFNVILLGSPRTTLLELHFWAQCKNHLLCEFDEYETIYSLWIALKYEFMLESYFDNYHHRLIGNKYLMMHHYGEGQRGGDQQPLIQQ